MEAGMLRLLAELNTLHTPDVVFFIVIGAIIAICVAVYFLIPVINRKQYQEMRENLEKRELAFNADKKQAESDVVADETEHKTEAKE